MQMPQLQPHDAKADYARMTKQDIARSKAYEALLDAHNEALHDARWGDDDTVKEEHLLKILGANSEVAVKLDGEVDISDDPSLPLACAHFWICGKVEKITL